MARTWSDPDEDQAYLARANSTWDRINAIRARATAADAQQLSTMAANYPHMSPGLAVPLAQAGVAPDDPLAVHVATQSARNNKKKRGFWGAVGDHVNPLKYLNGAVGDVLHPIGDIGASALKWTSRTGTALLQAPLELGMAGVRDIAAVGGNIAAGVASGVAFGAAGGLAFGGIGAIPGAIGGGLFGGILGAVGQARGVKIESEGVENPFTQTTLAQSFGSAGLGKGFFAAGTAHEAATRAQQRAAAINGHALTPGRYLASTVLEPGTTPYNLASGLVDAAVAWELDPAAKGGKALGKWRQTSRAFVRADEVGRAEAGLVEAARKTVLPERVGAWLNGRDGAKVTEWLADQSDFETIRRQLGGGKADVATVLDLTRARTPDEVAEILRPKLGLPGAFAEKPRVGTKGLEVKRAYQDSARVFNEMPSGVIDLHNPTEAVEQFDLFQRNAKIPLETISANNRAMAEALVSGDRNAAKAVFYDQFWGGEGGVLAKHNILPEMRRKLAKQLGGYERQALGRFVEEDGTQTAVRGLLVDGATAGLPNPGYLAAGTDDVLTFDRDAIRTIRRATSRYSSLVSSRPWTLGVAATDHLLTDLWKPLQLIRGAWTTRVVGEEQLRMAASGSTSLFSHPMSHMSWVLADDGKIANVFKKFGVDLEGQLGRGEVDILGERFAKEGSTIVPNMDLERELRGAAADFADATNIRAQAEGWLDGTNVLAKHQATYHFGDPDHARAWAEKIEMLHRDPLTRRLATDHPEDVRLWFSSGEGKSFRQAMIDQGAPLQSYGEIDTHLEAARKNVAHAAGGEYRTPGRSRDLGAARASDRRVLDAISTGELEGVPIYAKDGSLSKDFVKRLGEFDTGPETIVGSAVISSTGKSAMKKALDDGVRTMFTSFMAKPSAKLSRSPMFRQSYWAEADNVIFNATPEAQRAMLAAAEEAKLPKATIERLRGRAALGTGDMGLDEADLLLKGAALDKTQALLYDTAQRGQLSDVLRILMPFAEAQKEVFKVWAKVGTSNPQTVRRAQQVIEGARGSGFFHTDPSTGEEVFSFPLSEHFTEPLLGVPVPLTGRVESLNVFGSGILPGLGPAAQIPAGWILGDKPQYDDLHKMIDPFGASRAEGGGILESQLPGWFQKIRTAATAPESDRVFANAVKDVWASGVSAGRYRTDSPEAIREGLEHAKRGARFLYLIRGASQFLGAPAPPTPEFMAMDKDQKWVVTEKLSERYQALLKENPDTASASFLDEFGNNAFAFLQAKSYGTTAATPTSTEASDWLRANPGLAKDYGDVVGLFAPQGEEFDYGQYIRNIRSGATVSLTPEQYARAANDKVGKMVYFAQKDRFGPQPSKEQRAWLSDLRQVLRQQFPGFDETLPGKPDSETVKNKFIPQIEEAVNDERLADNDVARATKLYLQARTKAQQSAEASGYSTFAQAKAVAPLRDWLRQFADLLIAEVPDFGQVMDRIFEREMIDDDQLAAPQGAVA